MRPPPVDKFGLLRSASEGLGVRSRHHLRTRSMGRVAELPGAEGAGGIRGGGSSGGGGERGVWSGGGGGAFGGPRNVGIYGPPVAFPAPARRATITAALGGTGDVSLGGSEVAEAALAEGKFEEV